MIKLLRLDALHLVRDRLAAGILAAGLLACLVAVVAGLAWQGRLQHERDALDARIESTRTSERERWADIRGKDPVDVVDVALRSRETVRLAPPLLADFTVGRSAVEPAATDLEIGSRASALFARYQVENPESLARGAFDLGFVALVVAPLLLIGLGYGVFVGDRESGAARLWLAQAGSPLKLIAARSVNRVGLVIGPILVAALVLWLTGPAGRGGAILGWLGVAFLALCFWWAVTLLVNSLDIGAETSALALVGLWTVMVFVAPVAIGSVEALVNAPPSRFEGIAAARVAELASTQSYEDDHPELLFATLEGRRDWLRKGNAVRQSIARAVAPVEAETERQLAAQQRLGQRLALLSPTLLAADVQAGIARTDAGAYAAQRQAVKAHLAARNAVLTSAALGERPIDLATFAAIPGFEPPPPRRQPLFPVLWIAIVTAAIASVALVRLRRAKPL